jgi:hypothetical protein
MTAPNTTDVPSDDWPVQIATALPEVWGLVAEHGDGLVAAWRLMRVCKASRVGVKGWLRTLQNLVVCGGRTRNGEVLRDVWRLDLATLRWEPMPALLDARSGHACCAVRGTIVVLGGNSSSSTTDGWNPSVEMLSVEEGAFVSLPPLSCRPLRIRGAVALAVEESESAAGQVLLLGASGTSRGDTGRSVHLVDLATGVCTPDSNLRQSRIYSAAARLPASGRIVCAGGFHPSAEIYGPPSLGVQDGPWTWGGIPTPMELERHGSCGCVLSDGRFAILGGTIMTHHGSVPLSSCETLSIDEETGPHWAPMPSMLDSRTSFACAAIAGCIIVAGGHNRTSAEVFDEALGRWFRLPHSLPYEIKHELMGSALM